MKVANIADLRRFGAPLWILTFNWVWCIGIVYSAMATRQHLAVDAIGGLVLGVSASYLYIATSHERGEIIQSIPMSDQMLASACRLVSTALGAGSQSCTRLAS